MHRQMLLTVFGRSIAQFRRMSYVMIYNVVCFVRKTNRWSPEIVFAAFMNIFCSALCKHTMKVCNACEVLILTTGSTFKKKTKQNLRANNDLC